MKYGEVVWGYPSKVFFDSFLQCFLVHLESLLPTPSCWRKLMSMAVRLGTVQQGLFDDLLGTFMNASSSLYKTSLHLVPWRNIIDAN